MKRSLALALVVMGTVLAATAFAGNQATTAATSPALTAAPEAIDSLAILERVVAKDSTRFDNLYQLGVMYLDHERMQEAMQVFAKANQLQPKNVKVLVNLGIAADAQGHADFAQVQYQKALDLAPTDSIAACRMASSKYAQGKYDDSMKMIRDIIAKQPKAYCAYFTLGVAFADAGIYRDAIRMWHKVVDLAPDSPEAVSAKESIEVLEKFLAGK
ncbi:MAG TPA: tetratricopeptide repeat protein [Candidatus Acidoferrales bacterium]|nr:tetratricopeptide repeat protein [Candidatus Acidoferrales bacterium]